MYNNFNYISSEILVAELKEELKSYFDSGSLSEALIPTYISNCLRKLKVMVLEYREDIITLDNFRVSLPSDFAYLKDAWLLTGTTTITNPVATSVFEYYKKTYCNDHCDTEYEEFTKTSTTLPSWVITNFNPCLLKVYYNSKSYCTSDCSGLKIVEDADVVKIYNKTLTATFSTGDIFIQYWTQPEDEFGPLVPEIIEVEDYVKAYLYYKLFEQLYNSVTDESINIIERKLQFYRQNYYGKYESALNILKQETKQEIRDNISRQKRRFVKFLIN